MNDGVVLGENERVVEDDVVQAARGAHAPSHRDVERAGQDDHVLEAVIGQVREGAETNPEFTHRRQRSRRPVRGLA